MNKNEFEIIAGYEVSVYDYKNIIEPMYMATKLNKTEFVKLINRKEFEITDERKALDKIRLYAELLRLNPVKRGFFFAPKWFIDMVDDFALKFYGSKFTWIGCEEDEIRNVEYPYIFKIYSDYNREIVTFNLF